jgi:ubiquinone/menaquinone biosynthesis C-methylase UbiE
VLHHVTNREAWLGALARELRPGARLAVIEFREGRLPQGPPEAVKIPKAELIRLVQEAGFTLETDDPALLPYQTFLLFRRVALATP